MLSSTKRRFASTPEVYYEAILQKISREYPQYAAKISWNVTPTKATASEMGVSVTVDPVGVGPTDIMATASAGFVMRWATVKAIPRINQFLDELKLIIP